MATKSARTGVSSKNVEKGNKLDSAVRVLTEFVGKYTTLYVVDENGEVEMENDQPVIDKEAQTQFEESMKKCVDQVIKFAKLPLEKKIAELEEQLAQAETRPKAPSSTPPHSKIMNLISNDNLKTNGDLEVTISDNVQFGEKSTVGPQYMALEEKPQGTMKLSELVSFLKANLKDASGRSAQGMSLGSCINAILDQDSLARLLALYDGATTQSARGKGKSSGAGTSSSGKKPMSRFNQFTIAVTQSLRTVAGTKLKAKIGEEDPRMPKYFKPTIKTVNGELKPPKSWNETTAAKLPLNEYIAVKDALKILYDIFGTAEGGLLKIVGVVWSLGLDNIWLNEQATAEADEAGANAMATKEQSKSAGVKTRKTKRATSDEE